MGREGKSKREKKRGEGIGKARGGMYDNSGVRESVMIFAKLSPLGKGVKADETG